MNLIVEHKKRYIIVCFILAMVYAFLVGEQSITYRFTDGIIYGLILFIAGNIIWNIFHYAIPSKKHKAYSLTVLVVLSLLTSVLIVGIESFILYLCFPYYINDFANTIAVRIFISMLLFVIHRLFYNLYTLETNDSKATNSVNSQSVSEQTIDRITVRNGQKIKIIPINDILYFKADGDYIVIYTNEGHWLKEQTMKYTEDILPSNNFVRTHRSYIVNINYISRIERYGVQQLIILSNGEKIKISDARYQVLRQRLGF